MSAPSPSSDLAAREAIRYDLDATFVVEASAGTGKTTELVERIVNVLRRGDAEVGQIVAVTFTEKAAGELKLRLRQRLDAARTSEPAGGRERQRLARALAHLEEAHVNTIHGFAADLLRLHPVEAGVDPKFEILTDDGARALFRRAFDRWLERTLEQPPEGLRRALRRRRAGSDDDGGPVQRVRDAAWSLAEWRDFTGTWRRPPFDRTDAVLELTRRVRAVAALTAAPRTRRDALYVATRPVRDLARELARAIDAERPDVDHAEACLVAFAGRSDLRRLRRGYGAEYAAGVSRAQVLDAVDDLLGRASAFAREADGDLAALLQSELRAVVDDYERLKAAAGSLDFVDLLLRARDLVRDDGDVRRQCQHRFLRIFVDEFQDTDPLQAELLLLLAADAPSERDWRRTRPLPGRLFIVGDPKQSIYRFRRADVGVYWDVRDRVVASGGRVVELTRSYRSVPAVQRFVNAAFASQMTGDRDLLQASYVPLEPVRDARVSQPAVVALPVPEPYGMRQIAMGAIETSLPDAVGAFITWLLHESGWTVAVSATRSDAAPDASSSPSPAYRPLQARDVAILFRRFESWGRDVTRPYVDALEARNVPHLLVGGRSFHDREEVATLQAALSAIEWPDDELSVYATLKGSLFAVSDAALLLYRSRYGRIRPMRRPRAHGLLPMADAPVGATMDAELRAIDEALLLLGRLHARRNRVPVSETIADLLAATRAHAGFALRPRGEQALANVLHVAELARRYDADASTSFRAFVDALTERRFGDASEAPVLEDGSDGVRVMTVHRAKGLEFPVVVLADMTAGLGAYNVSRYLDADRGVAAIRLAGWAPHDLLDHEDVERARDRAEGVRVAYVAATRARDLLVVPAVGDGPLRREDKWLSPIERALYPPLGDRRTARAVAGCPTFGRDSVLRRPDDAVPGPEMVAPGGYTLGDAATGYDVVWWDPRTLDLGRHPSYGLRQTELIGREVAPDVVAGDVATYHAWAAAHTAAVERGRIPAIPVETVTARARRLADAGEVDVDPGAVTVVAMPRVKREHGARFGTLVHDVLALVPLDANDTVIQATCTARGRVLGATADEMADARDVVVAVLAHDILEHARVADARGACRREAPVSFLDENGVVVDGQVDLAFEDAEGWCVVDFKTDRGAGEVYRLQLSLYATAIATVTARPVRAVLFRV